jgi:hypothetical protein
MTGQADPHTMVLAALLIPGRAALVTQAPEDLVTRGRVDQATGAQQSASDRSTSQMPPNNSFKPNLLRYSKMRLQKA